MKENIKTSHCRYNTLCHPRVFLSGISTLLKKWLRLPITTFSSDSTARAFTLIELLVAVLIIGILAAVAVPQYNQAVWKSRFVKTKLEFNALMQAQERFRLANGKHASSRDELDVQVSNSCLVDTSKVYCWLRSAGKNVVSLQYYFPSKEFICCGFDKYGYSICSAESGKTSWYNGCGGESGCQCYVW